MQLLRELLLLLLLPLMLLFLLFGNGSEPQGLDPHIVTGVPEHHLLISMCEGLTIANPKGGDNLPGVAESWSIDEGIITCRIRGS